MLCAERLASCARMMAVMRVTRHACYVVDVHDGGDDDDGCVVTTMSGDAVEDAYRVSSLVFVYLCLTGVGECGRRPGTLYLVNYTDTKS